MFVIDAVYSIWLEKVPFLLKLFFWLINFAIVEAYLEPSRISTLQLFCKNNGWHQVFFQKSSSADVQLGSKYASV